MSEQAEQAPQEEAPPVEKPCDIPDGWEPNILAFTCHYCAFAAADLAGVMRLSYPTNVKIIRLPCSGKLDEFYVMHAFDRGVDGVFAAG